MPVSGGDGGGKLPVGSMLPWWTMRPVGNAPRPWPARSHSGRPAAGSIGIAGMGANIPSVPMSPQVAGTRLRFGRGRGLISRVNVREGNR